MNPDFIIAMAVLVVILAALLFLSMLIAPRSRGIVRFIDACIEFVIAELADVLRLFGALVVSLLHLPLIMMSLIIFRKNLAGHYLEKLSDEAKEALGCAYRILIARPLKAIGKSASLSGFEAKYPMLLEESGQRRTSAVRQAAFRGYTITGTLPTGGSGAKIYIAQPDPAKKKSLEREHGCVVDYVVIKNFSLEEGSSMPQIVRENRSLDAAVRLGLILEHGLTPQRFYHIMHHVPGDNLTMMIKRAHDGKTDSGTRITRAIGYVIDLLETLNRYHAAGLWHKDVKPDNIIIDARDGRARLVDFGLVTHLRSAMTLTTHGTEYFRDPEMVRMSLRGVKVHEISGVKFDIYGAGAVLYATLEDSFPAHGVLSRYTKESPEALRWIARRAMADYRKRYSTAAAMLTDLQVVASAADPFAVTIAELPGASEDQSVEVPQFDEEAAVPQPPKRSRVKLRNWWTGSFDVQ